MMTDTMMVLTARNGMGLIPAPAATVRLTAGKAMYLWTTNSNALLPMEGIPIKVTTITPTVTITNTCQPIVKKLASFEASFFLR